MDIYEVDIVAQPTGPIYQKLIHFAVDKFPIFVFVKGASVFYPKRKEEYPICLELAPYLIKHLKSNKWPGTEIMGGKVDVFYYRLCTNSDEILLRYSHALYQWQEPELPEDLSIMRNFEQPWLVTIAHEKASMLYVSNSEKAELIRTIPEFEIYMGEQGPPTAYY